MHSESSAVTQPMPARSDEPAAPHASLLARLRTACGLERWTADPDSLQLVSVDHESDGSVAPLAGADLVLETMRITTLARKTSPAVLLVGVHSKAELRDQLRVRYGSDALLDWPGLRYLQFVFDADDLASAAASTLQGRTAPLPLPSRVELLRCLRDVRHWVDRQRDVAAGHAHNCALVRDGRLPFAPDMLAPERRVLASHRDLFAYLVACVKLSPWVDNPALVAEELTVDFDDMLRLNVLIEQARQDAAPLEANAPDLGTLEGAFNAYAQAAEVLAGRLAVLKARVVAGEPSV